jgi:hypothetical protein
VAGVPHLGIFGEWRHTKNLFLASPRGGPTHFP